MKKCPICNQKLVDIIYGFPMGGLYEKEKKREIYLGGCVMIEGYQPVYHCYNCQKSFFENLKDYVETDDSWLLED